MEEQINYFTPLSYYTSGSKIEKVLTVSYETEIELFETYEKMNNRLRYCNGSYYEFVDKEIEKRYFEWLKTDDYKKKSWDLFYGNAVVD